VSATSRAGSGSLELLVGGDHDVCDDDEPDEQPVLEVGDLSLSDANREEGENERAKDNVEKRKRIGPHDVAVAAAGARCRRW